MDVTHWRHRSTGSRQAEEKEETWDLGEPTVTVKASFFTTACHGEAASEDGRKMRTPFDAFHLLRAG